MAGFIALLAVAVVAWRAVTKEQRLKALRALDAALAQVREHGRADLERFRPALRARTRWPVMTFALAALNVAVFLMPRGNGAQIGSVPWGASFGPLTSNGEWWRLV